MRREVDPDIYCPQAALIDEETARKAELRLAKYRARVEAAKEQQIMALQRQQQQQQRMWMVGGAFVVIAVSYIWYKRNNGQKRSKRNHDNENKLPRDLCLEEDDECTVEELQQLFGEAAKVARQFPNGMLDQRDQLMLYGLYKQANKGDRGDDNAVSFKFYMWYQNNWLIVFHC